MENQNVWLLLCLLLFTGCSESEKNKQSNDSTLNEVEFSEFNWNTYLKKENFEKVDTDSGFLAIVKPTYAIFIFLQTDMETDVIASYDITGFEKKNNKWIKTINDQISDLGFKDSDYNLWRYKDVNSDGIKDIMLKIDENENHGCKYMYFIQDKQNGCFVKGKEIVNSKNCSFQIPH